MKRLRIDRQHSFNDPQCISCLNLEGTLLCINEHGISFRPGAAELLEELIKYSLPFFYSDLPEEQAADAIYFLKAIYASQKRWANALATSSCVIPIIDSYERIITPEGPLKSLRNLAQELGCRLEEIWLFDRPNALVDAPSQLIPIPEFHGDISDRYLYELIDQIFIN